MSPGGTTGMLVQGDSAPSLPMLTDEDGVSIKNSLIMVIEFGTSFSIIVKYFYKIGSYRTEL